MPYYQYDISRDTNQKNSVYSAKHTQKGAPVAK